MKINEYLESIGYPGRIIAAGMNEKGEDFLLYAITGRSPNSRNRVLSYEKGVLRTIPKDCNKVENPGLIIYDALKVRGDETIITNGAHTDTVYEKGLEKAVAEWSYEDDPPIFTPRIFLSFGKENYSLAIVRKKGSGAERKIFNYDKKPGKAHVIHTYTGSDATPFDGEPVEVDVDFDSIDSIHRSIREKVRIAEYVKVGGKEEVVNEGERMDLKYGVNPNQKNAYIERKGGLPLEVLNGRPGYINFLDALNGFLLVSDLKKSLSIPAAASFKHVSPSGAAIGVPLSDDERRMYFVSDDDVSPLASAYIRARGTDRMSSFGDFISLSDTCDKSTARYISKEVSDGIIAPGYTDEALEILKRKKKGAYVIIKIDSDYSPDTRDVRRVFGIDFVQKRNLYIPSDDDFENIVTLNRNLTPEARRDLTVALLTLKYTQSNSVCYAYNGQTIGVGAGQQSRIHCTRLAGDKADRWLLRKSERVLSLPFKKGITRNEKDNVIEQYLSEKPEIDVIGNQGEYFLSPVDKFLPIEKEAYLSRISGVSVASDAFFPFRDNIDRAVRSGVSYIAAPGGSERDKSVIGAANEYNAVMCFITTRLFCH